MRAARLVVLALAIAATVGVPAASGDVIAAVDVPVGLSAINCPQQTDIALIDAATGAHTALPSGINTAADELHPSINSLGTLMTFARVDHAAGTTQIVYVNLVTGQQAQLFNVFDASTLQPNDPVLTPDGSVMTGAAFQQMGPQDFRPFESVTSVANFPGGPFPHSMRTNGDAYISSGHTLDPSVRSDGQLAVQEIPSASTGGISLVGGVFGFAKGLEHPALSDPSTNVVVFSHEVVTNDGTLAHLAFSPVAFTFDKATPVDLPAAINATGSDEFNAAFTPDGRYLGFVRYAHSGDLHMRLFVFDTQTQTMLNNSGIDLGSYSSFGCESSPTRSPAWPIRGGISLRETIQLLRSEISPGGLISFLLSGSSGVGILVQRIVGHHKLFGHTVPTLKKVGRVPLGQFRRGKHKVHWDLRVNGRRLRKGTYLITPRLVSRNGVVHELGKPRKVRIR